MKRKLLVLLSGILVLHSYHLMAQNVGIGTSAPASRLHIIANDASVPLRIQNTLPSGYTGIHFHASDGTLMGHIGFANSGAPTLANSFYAGSIGNAPFVFTTNDAERMRIDNNGNVGIGTGTPVSKLTVQTPDDTYGMIHTNGTLAIGTVISQGYGWLGTLTSHPLILTTGNTQKIIILTNGNVGIGTSALPVNKLQIGFMGTTGFTGNDLAIGNGVSAMGIAQSNSTSTFSSSTDIVFRPRNNGAGRIGINTNTPRAALDVASSATVSGGYYYLNGSGVITLCSACNSSVSIYASNAVMAEQFDAYSDARIKDIIGPSDPAGDLQTLNKLHITDYTLKDKIQHGNKRYKKVIAQQVEKVFPQIVSLHTDFIPNVYQLAAVTGKTANGYALSFPNKHTISPAAKKLRVILAEGGAAEMDIVSIPSATQVIIHGKDIQGDKLFVYGEEVADFRTVDYEGLTTLNISATQELSKQVDVQNRRMEVLEQEIKWLKEKLIAGPEKK